MKLQITTDEVIAEDFRQLAKDNHISHEKLFEFLVINFLKSGTPQVRAGKLAKVERKIV